MSMTSKSIWAMGSPFSTSDTDIWRNGNVYTITSQQHGNCVRATVNSTWIDAWVGLGSCCSQAEGLLSNPNGNVNQLRARNGALLVNPFTFDDLYHRYGDSWRVPPAQSLFTALAKPHAPIAAVEISVPRKMFFAHDLESKTFEKARATAAHLGVKEGPLLDAATLDVTVLGDEKAALVFVDATPPVAVAKIIAPATKK